MLTDIRSVSFELQFCSIYFSHHIGHNILHYVRKLKQSRCDELEIDKRRN